ncbi:hypothetical protein M0805_003986 [Coniferiporia weirii]|nr:hypothetical protein M0805_003986 [Coniferiporia weirii]
MWPCPTLSSSSARGVRRNYSFLMYAHQPSNHFGGSIEGSATPARLLPTFFKAILATALFRCWHILLFFIGWATAITLINEKVTNLTMQSTLLTVIGTVLGFVISYRTTSSFERYNEGRRYWSQIILASRTLARTVWFHVPELPPATPSDENEGRTVEERKARTLIEKKTVINLTEAFSVAVKHYLRGEEGINYVDLYHLVKFLPSYAFPAGMMTSELDAESNLRRTQSYRSSDRNPHPEHEQEKDECPSVSIELASPTSPSNGNGSYFPAATVDAARDPNARRNVTLDLPLPVTTKNTSVPARSVPHSNSRSTLRAPVGTPRKTSFARADDDGVELLPASLPPKYTLFDLFPFSLLIKLLAHKGHEVDGKKAARYRAKNVVVTHNVPLEISMYLTSYVATLSARKSIDVPTTNLLIASVNQLTDALTGLERILTTPIPFSYSIHLWLVTIIYVLALPFQIYATLRWITIPATAIMSFIFFGFLVAGEEIENPFGYDKNDLNMDHFTHDIIRNELRALTAFPPPDPEHWAFSPRNNHLFSGNSYGTGRASEQALNVTPVEWVDRGADAMKDVLARY